MTIHYFHPAPIRSIDISSSKYQIPNPSEEKLFTRQDAATQGQPEHVGFAGQVPPVL
jgi:hypothetical protein